MRFKNDLLLQECEFYAQDKIYIVKPISFYYIRKREFERDNIFTFGDEFNKLLFSSLVDETGVGQTKINKWLERLVITSSDEKLNLAITARDNWDRDDLADLFKTILEISGLKEDKDKTKNAEDTDNEDEYSFLFASLLMNGTMTRDEILNSSLPYLNEIFKNINEIRIKTSGFGGFGSVPSDNANSTSEKPIETTDMEEFANSINQFYGK